MSNDSGRRSRGLFDGKEITFAPTHRVDEYQKIASEFMQEIFDFMPGDYLISDESDIRDFTDFGSSDTSEIWIRIQSVYGFARYEVDSECLADIFAEIARRRNLQ